MLCVYFSHCKAQLGSNVNINSLSLSDPCLLSYLNVKIKEGKAHNIQCPAFDCSALVPVVSKL